MLNQALADLQVQTTALEERVEERTQALVAGNEQLERKKREIEKKNIALKVLLDYYQVNQDSFEAQVASRITKFVFPYLELLGQDASVEARREYLALIRGHLESLVSSFSKTLSRPGWNLTRKENLVADLIKQGKSTSEIGSLLKISPRTVETHRNNIRKKIGLANKKTRLAKYLRSLSIDG